jgi:hypothetical protein
MSKNEEAEYEVRKKEKELWVEMNNPKGNLQGELEKAWNETYKLLLEFKRECKKYNTEFTLLILPGMHNWESAGKNSHLQLKKWADDNDIKAIDFFPILDSYLITQHRTYKELFNKYFHYNMIANRVIANEIYRHIKFY